MTDPDNDSINAVAFGRVLGTLTHIEREIKELKDRVVYRLDSIETRVEILEKADTTQQIITAWTIRSLFALVGGTVVYILRHLGVF